VNWYQWTNTSEGISGILVKRYQWTDTSEGIPMNGYQWIDTSERIPAKGYQWRDTSEGIPVNRYQWTDTSEGISVNGYQWTDTSERIPVSLLPAFNLTEKTSFSIKYVDREFCIPFLSRMFGLGVYNLLFYILCFIWFSIWVCFLHTWCFNICVKPFPSKKYNFQVMLRPEEMFSEFMWSDRL
jgi:hypothetical protein